MPESMGGKRVIRLAKIEDMNRIMEVYAIARRYMADNGNAGQWGASHPPREMLEQDIRNGQLFADTEGDEIHGVFMFAIGPEPTYSYIEDGAWKNDELYGTIHRIAGDGVMRGVFGRCLEFCKGRISNVRIDTHSNNHTMRHLIEKSGFKRCGIIYVEDGSPRIAYQYTAGE